MAEQKSSILSSKYNQSLLLVGLVLVLAVILFVVFGPVDINNLGQVGKRQEKQQSFAYALEVPSPRDLVVSAAGNCDAAGNRSYSFGWFASGNLPKVEKDKELYFRFAIRSASSGDWEYAEGSGFLYKLLPAGENGKSVLYQYRLATGVNTADEKFESDLYSEPVTFAASCKKEAALCLPYGDVDLDGDKDKSDLSLINKYISDPGSLSSPQLIAADANRDGQINFADVEFVSANKCSS